LLPPRGLGLKKFWTVRSCQQFFSPRPPSRPMFFFPGPSVLQAKIFAPGPAFSFAFLVGHTSPSIFVRSAIALWKVRALSPTFRAWAYPPFGSGLQDPSSFLSVLPPSPFPGLHAFPSTVCFFSPPHAYHSFWFFLTPGADRRQRSPGPFDRGVLGPGPPPVHPKPTPCLQRAGLFSTCAF